MDKISTNSIEKPATPPIMSTQPIVKLVKLPASTIASSCDTVSNQEQIVEKAKQVNSKLLIKIDTFSLTLTKLKNHILCLLPYQCIHFKQTI